jgi:hypothetical protein
VSDRRHADAGCWPPASPPPGTGCRQADRQPLPAHHPGKDGRGLARRLSGHEDLILRFATQPDLNTFSNNEAGWTTRPPKSSNAAPEAACDPLQELADFALTQS